MSRHENPMIPIHHLTLETLYGHLTSSADDYKEMADKVLEQCDEIRQLRAALEEISRLRLDSGEVSLANRADRMWEIAESALGRPVPDAKPFS